MPVVQELGGRDHELREGPRWEITIGPGVIALGTKDYARIERTAELQRQGDRKTVDMLAVALGKYLDELGPLPKSPEPTRTITGWSQKSISAMCRRAGELDYAPLFVDPTRIPAMVTLTYPRCWLRVAPSGKVVKKHFQSFCKRYARAWGEELACLWKQEFQARHPKKRCRVCPECVELDDGRAPHIHMLMTPPHGQVDGLIFREWLSRAWADVVAHPDLEQYRKHIAAGTAVDFPEGLRASDPRRVAVYFSKHGAFSAKAYQHNVPRAWQEPGKGPGRFWGHRVLEKATVKRQLDAETSLLVGRTLRRWARAQGTTRQVTRMRVEQATGRVQYRKTRIRAVRLKSGRGWVAVNDGPAMASQIARLISVDSESPQERRERLIEATGITARAARAA